MQTETGQSNGGAVVMGAAQLDYLFDAAELKVEVPRGNSIVTVVYKKPELEQYLALEKATQVMSRVVDGALIDDTQRSGANGDFFDEIVLSASKRKKDEINPSREYDQDECKRFPFEFKNEVVARINSSQFEVEAEGDDLLDTQGNMRVKQVVGDSNAPSYVIFYDIKTLPPAQRQEYQKAIQVKRRIKNANITLETDVHIIKKAMKLFAPNFNSVEGGRLESGPFTPDKRQDFIAQIDPTFQVGVIDAICGYYSGGLD